MFPDNIISLGIEILHAGRPVEWLVVPGSADVGLVEDTDPVDGGEADQAFGDPGRQGGAHHVQNDQGSI